MSDDTDNATYVSESDMPKGGGEVPAFDPNVMIHPKHVEPPPEAPGKIYPSERRGRDQAYDEEHRPARRRPEHEEQTSPVRVRTLPDDAPRAFKDPKDAARWRAADLKVQRALKRSVATGEDPLISAHIVGAEGRDELAAKAAGTNDIPVISYQDKAPSETVTDRQAAQDLAEYRRTTKAQEAAALDEQRRLQAELGVADWSERQQPAAEETPAEAVQQPAEQQRQLEDAAVLEARQRAQVELQVIQHLRGATQAELLASAKIDEIRQGIESEFTDCRTMEDVAKLPPERQQRWAEWQKSYAAHETQRQQAAFQRQQTERAIAEARQHQEGAEFARWKHHQDQVAAKDLVELQDPKQAHEFRETAHQILKEYLDITPETARNLKPEFRRAMNFSGFQRLVADATRFRLMKTRAAQVTAEPLPQPVRPGIGRDHRVRMAEINDQYMKKLDHVSRGARGDAQIRAMAEVLAEKRRAQVRGR